MSRAEPSAAIIADGEPVAPDAVLTYWFDTLGPRGWFRKRAATDRDIARQFGATLVAAARCELWSWRAHARGRLAEILVLDQFSRNVFRDTAAAFANDPLALALAQEAVAHGADRSLTSDQRAFLYMPYMHSESLTVHTQALQLFDQSGLETHLKQERQHYDILQRFGRYPHRNACLGRTTSDDEQAFLAQPGSSF